MKKESPLDLVQLTEEFLEILNDMYNDKVLTKEQYDLMSRKKQEFVNMKLNN